MEVTEQKQEHIPQPQNPKTLAEQREQITPEEPDDWFDSQESEKSLQDSDEQEQSKITNTSNMLKSVLSVQKEELPEYEEYKKEKIQTVEKIQSQRLVKEKIQQMQLQKQKEYKSFYHKLDQKLSLVLLKMLRLNLVNLNEISGLKGNGVVELFHKNKQIIVKTADKATADEAINKISDFVDDLNVLRLDIKHQLASKIQSFRKVRAQLNRRKIILFHFENVKEQRGLYIGGLIKPSELKKIQLEMRNYKIFKVRLRRYMNRRSYKIILDKIFQSELFKKQMMKFSSVNLIQVDRANTNREINVIMNIQSKIDIPASQYEDFLFRNIRKYVVINFILSTQPYFPKLSVKQQTEINFIYITERNNKRRNITYLLIIAETQTFFKFYKQIQTEIEKVGQFIFGIRFFNFLFPNFSLFRFDPDVYFVKRFPKINTYSMIVTARQREGKKYYWRQTYHMFLQMKQLIEKAELQQPSAIQQDQT